MTSQNLSILQEKSAGTATTYAIDAASFATIRDAGAAQTSIFPTNAEIVRNVLLETGDVVSENKINADRLDAFAEIHARKLVSLVRRTEIEFGVASPVETMLEQLININRLATLTLVQDIFVEHFRKRDREVLVGLLIALSRIRSDIVGAQGTLIATNALLYPDAEVKEAGLRAFEGWCALDSADWLEALDLKDAWLKSYRDEVVSYIKKRHVVAGA